MMVRFLRTVTYEIDAPDYSAAQDVWNEDGPRTRGDGVSVFAAPAIRCTDDGGEDLPRVGVVATPGKSWAIPMGGQVGLDTTSSASRQHRIDTGEFLRKGEAWSS
jgi:hypothetical protein